LENAVVAFLQCREGEGFLGDTPIERHSEEELAGLMGRIDRMRYAGPRRVPAAILEAAARQGFYIARAPVLMEGRIELLHYLHNQSVCDMYHRYGNLGERALLR
jgi:RHH-type proline utilization regulon transcriptional repressor/proline dehydrogenase/delta 1-pyrroline-5-carboxylate dehydrogenase